MVSRRTFLTAAGASALSLAGCLNRSLPPAADARESFEVPAGDGYVHLHDTANPVVAGRADLSDAARTVAYLGGTPRWVAGVPRGDASLWAVVLDDTSVLGLHVSEGSVERVPVSPARLGNRTLPVVRADSGTDGIELVTDAWTTSHSHPVRVGDRVGAVLGDGRVSLRRGDERRLADVDALSDARPVAADGRLAVLAGRTTAYPHGALGDDTEAEALSVVSATGEEVARLSPPNGGVFEGTGAIAADVDGDGEAEFVTTATDAEEGARIVALDPSGDHRVGPAIGRGFRWRHPLAVAPFGPNGELEVAAVKTPHVGGVAEFYRPGERSDSGANAAADADGGGLAFVAESDGGYGTHAFGSRNLAGAVAGRLAGDDRWCLLVPTGFGGGDLSVLGRTEGGVETVTRLSLPAARTTNLAAVGVGDAGGTGGENDGVHLVAGTDDGLLVWTA